MQQPSVKQLIGILPQQGRVEWIGVRPGKRQPVQIIDSVRVLEAGLQGDHYSGSSGRRGVTLIQAEHIEAVASMLHRGHLSPEMLRRNIVVRGINLLALKDREFSIGSARLRMTGLCHPCSRMEEVLGEGGYNAMRGHGGINACVIQTGNIAIGDPVIGI
jgi:MOSC domain-containing protein YiiM